MTQSSEVALAYWQLANRYTDGVNRKDWQAVASCFTPEGEWYVGPPLTFTKRGRAEILERLAETDRLPVAVQFIGSNLLVESSDTHATGRTTIREIGRRTSEVGLDIFGLYDDELTYEEDKWLFQRRSLTLLALDRSPRNELEVYAPWNAP